MASSITLRRPRAPVSLVFAMRAISPRASGVNSNSASSMEKNFWYCRTREFFGSVMMRTRSSSPSGKRLLNTGSRPTSSGIKPNSRTSSTVTSARSSRRSFSVCSGSSVWPKPIMRRPLRLATMSSRPTNVPPQMNRMFVVSIWMYCCSGCLRPPCGGTLATVPSSIFSKACWTPSPETSRVIDTLLVVLPILSISSMNSMPRWAASISKSAACSNLSSKFSTSSPT